MKKLFRKIVARVDAWRWNRAVRRAPTWIKGDPTTEAIAECRLCPIDVEPCDCARGDACVRHADWPTSEVDAVRQKKVTLGRTAQFLRMAALRDYPANGTPDELRAAADEATALVAETLER